MIKNNDGSNFKVTGQITDEVFKKGVLVERRVGHNLVVKGIEKLIMCLLKNQSNYEGIQYWAVGSGSSNSPSKNDVKLESEIGRVPISASEIVFMNGSSVSSTPTKVLRITHTFGENDCNGSWKEFGIFGGNATTTKDSGIMIDRKTHDVLTKTSDIEVKRIMTFTLTLV